MKILSIVGARPQFIKLGPLSRELRKQHQEIIIHTGQHYDHAMSDLFFEQLEIPVPDINLETGSGLQGAQTGRMLEGIEREMLSHKPDLMICFGDTNSTLAACLAASKLGIPSLHIEAGLRSFNRSMPEEINRVVADHTSDLLFAPTETAMNHLADEGLSTKSVLTGDIMVDSVRFVQARLDVDHSRQEGYLLITLHRPYNVDDPVKLNTLFSLLSKLEQPMIFPVHPRTRNIIEKHQISLPENLQLIHPQGYIEFQGLLKGCSKVVTDSGGLQKEAYLAGKPCITLRPETEWVETVEAGWNRLCDINDPDLATIIQSFQPTGKQPNLYGKDVAKTMVEEIEKWFELRD
ncbi:MAG: UDP-N-acetylglucosamine 2-epimerase (non-hydrolyzing) [Balneolaceae bacterium]|nr:MAG: UDP-N-acetylglucosamine 2-epimerase (non-hydrolyzing) [Balneolaceae bacterium]